MARIELFLVWESNCRGIIDDIQALPERLLEDIKVRIFVRKDTPVKSRPPNAKWIELYHSFTTSPYASDTTLVAFLIKYFKDLAYFSDEESGTDSSCDPVEFYFVVDSDCERKFEELIAILDLDCKSKVKMKVVNGEEENIPQVLGFNFCNECQEAFDDADKLDEHDKTVHDFFCNNQDCLRSKIRFYNQHQLDLHKAQQTSCRLCHDNRPTFCDDDARVLHMRVAHGQDVPNEVDDSQCQFCPKKVFSSAEQKEAHMRNTHKKCNCGCAVYFESREHYLEHFYSVYPLACFENRKCPYRFQTVFHQAEHHKNNHNSEHSYYCIPCSTRDDQSLTGRVGRVAFKDEKSLRHHGGLMGHAVDEMFLNQQTTVKPIAKSSAINYC